MKKITMLMVLLLLPFTVPAAAGVTKIVPSDGAEPGEPFTIIDAPDGRIVDGSVAVFSLSGNERTIPLRTHKPFNTAQGRLPTDLSGGLYDVSVQRPDGTEFFVGTFLVIAPVLGEPSIEPICGIPGASFTITDPQGRIQQGDVAVFYPEGTDPAQGTSAGNVLIDSGGTRLTGNVPQLSQLGFQHFVSVRPVLGEPSRFGDLPFFVTTFGRASDGTILPNACIQPTSAGGHSLHHF